MNVKASFAAVADHDNGDDDDDDDKVVVANFISGQIINREGFGARMRRRF